MIETIILIRKICEKAEKGKVGYEDALRRIEALLKK